MKSVMTHQFSVAPQVGVQRSKFDRSCGYKTTFDSGYLVPFFCDEVLPGDTFDVNATLLVRETTPIVPIMDNIKLSTFFFFVPNRLVWEHWQNFCGERVDPDDSIDYLIPTITAPEGGFGVGTIYDYLGLPPNVAGIKINALPLRAINLIYNEWFRDENLIESLTVPKGDEADDPDLYTLQRRGKRYDYFTSCLPWPQKGPGVELPIGTSAPIAQSTAPVVGTSRMGLVDFGPTTFGGYMFNEYGVDQAAHLQIRETSSGQAIGNNVAVGLHTSADRSGVVADLSNITVDLSTATGATINSLRQAFALQAFYEQFARGGTRYIEIIRSFFQVVSPDARLQRPEYLGGNTSYIYATEIAQTSASNDVTPQGNVAALVKDGSSNHGFVKSFVEHGYIIGFVQIDADLSYQQGIDRMWSRSTMFDFYWPTFAHLGEQAVLNKEIYAQGTDEDDAVFGYQERYAEYRYKNSLITGKMRSGVTGSLDVWHLAQYFETLPTLSQDFIESNPPISRNLAVQNDVQNGVQNEPEFYLDAYISNKCIRPMPLYGTPSTIGSHF